MPRRVVRGGGYTYVHIQRTWYGLPRTLSDEFNRKGIGLRTKGRAWGDVRLDGVLLIGPRSRTLLRVCTPEVLEVVEFGRPKSTGRPPAYEGTIAGKSGLRAADEALDEAGYKYAGLVLQRVTRRGEASHGGVWRA
jgi:hypothetical protein